MNAVKYRTPGVYFETIDPAPRRITEVSSDIAGFVGVAERGPLQRAVKIKSWTQFRTRFGGRFAEGFLASAVYGFFSNGGRTCWVVRVGNPAPGARRAALVFANVYHEELLRVEALDYGPRTENIRVRIERAANFRFSLSVLIGSQTVETWQNLSMDRADPSGRYALEVVNDVSSDSSGQQRPERNRESLPSFRGSVLIELFDVSSGRERDRQPVFVSERDKQSLVAGAGTRADGFLGDDTSASPVLSGLTLAHFTGENVPPEAATAPWGLACLEAVPEVTLVAIPDLMWPGEKLLGEPKQPPPTCSVLGLAAPRPVQPNRDPREAFGEEDQRGGQQALIRHCATLKDRFALLDTPWGLVPDQAMHWAEQLRCEMGQYAGLYYPWLYVADPNLLSGDLRAVPPSGHVAGMTARVDLSVGVQKPPANERIEDARAVIPEFGNATHGQLNDAAVNAILAYPGRGIRVAGARTLTDRDHPEWRFVNVRRLLIMIEQSIEQATQWVVFEPNNAERWRDVDRVVRNFLDEEWRSGRLDGATANQAYTVICDETTNPPEETDRGKLICQIGVQPPQPAEFVIVRIGRTLDQTGNTGEGRDASG